MRGRAEITVLALALASGCAGVTLVDADGDGYLAEDDCDDGAADVHPGATETCDGLDNDCNGAVDDTDADTDLDGFDDCVDPTPLGFDGAAGREAPLSMQLHLHGSLSECNGTMAYHTWQAETYGVDVLWWSDHDNMISMTNKLQGFDFECGELVCEVQTPTGDTAAGFHEIENDLEESSSEIVVGGPSGEGYAWRISGRSAETESWQHVMHSFSAPTVKAHQMPLMADVTVELDLLTEDVAHEDWQLRVTALLSYNLDEQPNTITYFLGGEDLSEESTDTLVYLPIDPPVLPGDWSTLQLPLTEIAMDHFDERDDLATLAYIIELYSRRGAAAGLVVDDLRFHWTRSGDALWQYQKQVLAERHSSGPVTHFVGQEMSHIEDWRHINPFGVEDVPLLDYAELGLVPVHDAVDHVHEHGSIAQCNHPFGSMFVIEHEGEDADALAESLVQEWLAADGFGCQTVEVGYPQRVVDLEHHLMFWDQLGLGDLRITGTGVNDHHWASDWMAFSNPFLTWVFLDEPSRAGIADALERGRAFFGDPAPFVGRDPRLDIWCEHGAVMGQILQTDLSLVFHVETGTVDPGWWIELVVDGQPHERVLLAGDESDTVFEIERGDVRVVRAQILDETEAIILVSNPIYLVRSDEDQLAGVRHAHPQ